jgi:hypothetical protein
MTGTIIISYREGDAIAMAHRLGDRLESLGYHCLFMSEHRGTSGRDYPAGREDTIAAGDGFLAVIGPRWLVRYDERGRPGIHHRDDFIRKDIAAALGRDVPILVVLAEGAKMPSPALLPGDLLLLAYQPATELRGAQFDGDIDRLVVALRRLVPAGP